MREVVRWRCGASQADGVAVVHLSGTMVTCDLMVAFGRRQRCCPGLRCRNRHGMRRSSMVGDRVELHIMLILLPHGRIDLQAKALHTDFGRCRRWRLLRASFSFLFASLWSVNTDQRE